MPVYFRAMARIVYLDSWMLVLDKQAGEAVQGRNASQNALLRDWRRRLEADFLQPVHRIDQPVSGLVVLARDRETFTSLQHWFRMARVRRTYLAVVSAPPPEPEGILQNLLTVDEVRNRSRVVAAHVAAAGARSARLRYRLVGATDHHHIVEVELETGRHHQIRAQLAYHGCPILGDTKYGARRPLRGGGIGLLAWQLTLPHPVMPVDISLRASFPPGSMWEAVRRAVVPLPPAGASAAD